MILVGIDPGLTGAIAFLGHKGEYLGVHDIPTMARMGPKAFVKNQVNGAALEELLAGELGAYDKNEIRVFVETPIAFPGQHVATTAAAFLTAGIIEGVVAARHYPHELVAPKDWKRAIGLPAKGDLKQTARARAVRLFPQAPLGRVRDHNRAEALLIAKYGHERVN